MNCIPIIFFVIIIDDCAYHCLSCCWTITIIIRFSLCLYSSMEDLTFVLVVSDFDIDLCNIFSYSFQHDFHVDSSSDEL